MSPNGWAMSLVGAWISGINHLRDVKMRDCLLCRKIFIMLDEGDIFNDKMA